MALIVQKYGGTSVGNVERIQNVARRVVRTAAEGHQVAVIVSAMSGETDRLTDLAHQLNPHPPSREMDVILNTGEQVTVALLAMAIEAQGYKSRSFLGHQVRIRTDSNYQNAKILDIDTKELVDSLSRGEVAVIAGFQGIDADGNLTTLGRGGSDTTAVAIAAALKAELCEICTDVDGVYTTDPNICPEARKIERISYEETLEMASLGAKVLHHRSVFFASKYQVNLSVRSSFNDNPGTLIVPAEESMEQVVVRAITYDKKAARIRFMGVKDEPGVAAKIFVPIGRAGVNVDLIIQNSSTDGFTDLTFTVAKEDEERALELCRRIAEELDATLDYDSKIAKLSIIGLGMRTHAGIAATFFDELAKAGINIEMVSTSEIKVSAVIREDQVDEAVRVLHRAFNLDKDVVYEESEPAAS